MKCFQTEFDGLVVIETFYSSDTRGSFTKTYHSGVFHEQGIHPEFHEFFASRSGPNTLRGMHFQLPPFHHDKLVFVLKGSITDVVLDLRKDYKTYGSFFEIALSESNRTALFIPAGMAHGFLSLEPETLVCYLTTSVHSPAYDTGILWNSFGYSWDVLEPIISDRDQRFLPFAEFESPFRKEGCQ